MSNVLKVEFPNLDKVLQAFARFPRVASENMRAAGREAAVLILQQEGLQKYPPGLGPMPAQPFKTDKQRRFFFWALRNGIIEVPYRRGKSPGSEKYGAMWVINAQSYQTSVSNRTTYAQLLGGANQSQYMGRLGWRKLLDVAKEQLAGVTRIYQNWINKTIKDVGL